MLSWTPCLPQATCTQVPRSEFGRLSEPAHRLGSVPAEPVEVRVVLPLQPAGRAHTTAEPPPQPPSRLNSQLGMPTSEAKLLSYPALVNTHNMYQNR